MKCWFVDRDHYFMVYDNPHITGQYFIPNINTTRGPFFILESMAFLEDHGKA